PLQVLVVLGKDLRVPLPNTVFLVLLSNKHEQGSRGDRKQYHVEYLRSGEVRSSPEISHFSSSGANPDSLSPSSTTGRVLSALFRSYIVSRSNSFRIS